MKAVIFAYHDMGCSGLISLIDSGFTVLGVFTHNDPPTATPFYGSVANIARSYNIPVYTPDNIAEPHWTTKISELNPDYIFSFSFRQNLTAEILAIPAKGAFNVHASLLPAYRGRAHLNWVLINGEERTGITLHRISSEPDAGPILAQQVVNISAQDDALSLHQKLVGATRKHLPGWLLLLVAGVLKEQPQDGSQASCFGARKPEDGQINWHQPASKVDNFIRALAWPWPGAFCFIHGKRMIIWKSEVRQLAEGSTPAAVISVDPLIIACATGAIEVISAQVDIAAHPEQ